MKRKCTAGSFSTKSKIAQRRNYLVRKKDDLPRRSVRVLLSPLPHFSPFKAEGNSITNCSPRTNIMLVDRRNLTHDERKTTQTNEETEKIRVQVATSKLKKQRRCAKRKTEAEKLNEESLNKHTNDGNIFSTRRALRSRLILTPKSPLVRVKRAALRNKSRRISSTSLNEFLSRDVVIELEKVPRNEELLKKNSSSFKVTEPVAHVDESYDNASSLQTQMSPLRDVRVILEKLPSKVTPPNELKNVKNVSSVSLSSSKKNASCLEPPLNETEINGVLKSSENMPLREVRILLDKLTDSVFTSGTPRLKENDTRHVDMEEIHGGIKVLLPESRSKLADANYRCTEKSCEVLSTPSMKTVPEQSSTPITPIMVSECQPAPVNTPTSSAVDDVGNSKKMPKSLDIPLRRVTIVKSKFAKINRALGSSPNVTPVKVYSTSTCLFSPSTKPTTCKSDEATTQTTDSTLPLYSSIKDTISSTSSSSADKNDISSETSVVSKSSQLRTVSSASFSSFEMRPSTLESQSCIDAANILRRTEPSSSKPKSVPKSSLFSSKLSYDVAKSNKGKSVLVKKIPKTSSASTLKKNESMLMPRVESSPSSQSASPCPEIGSPLSRGQLLTAKSLAYSPYTPKMILMKSRSQAAHSTKLDDPRDTSGKTCTKSPLNRGRLLTEQSLSASSKYSDSDSSGKEIRRSASAGSSLHRSHSHVSYGSKEQQNVTYKQKWASAGDLLKMSSQEKEGIINTMSDTEDLSTLITPLDSIPTTAVFSNAKTCTSILSTLESADRNKSKSASKKLLQQSACEDASSLDMPPNTSQNSTKMSTPIAKSVSSSQPNLSEKLAKVQIDSTTTSLSHNALVSQSIHPGSFQAPKMKFHIPKVKPGDSHNFKKPMPPLSSFPRSGFTPSPPHKSSLIGSVLGKSTYGSSSYVAPKYSRQLQPKSSRISNLNVSSAKPYISRSQSSSVKLSHVSDSQLSSAKHPYTSNYHSSTITPSCATISSQFPTKPPHTSNINSDTNLSTLKKSRDPRLYSSTTKPSLPSSSQLPFAKPTPNSHLPSTKPPYVPSYQPPSSKPKTPIATPPVSKTDLPVKRVTDFKTPSASGSHSSHKSRPFKNAYMSSRSSNTASFSKYLPSGPQYSPSYSKYLQNGFSHLPKAQYKLSEAPKPTSPGTSEVLRWSTANPCSIGKPAPPPVGPSDSLSSSVLTSDPAYSPLCPQFNTQER